MAKRIICAVLAALIISSLFVSCKADKKEEKKDDSSHTLYFKDSSKSKEAAATFFNSKSGKKKTVKMKKVSEDKNSRTFSCKGDTSAYNMAFVTCGKKQTKNFAFNKCVSGWHQKKDKLIPFVYGKEIDYNPTSKEVSFPFKDDNRLVHIWTPDDYDAKSEKKYSTIYILDGQAMEFSGREDQVNDESMSVTAQVEAMTAETGEKAIIVGIENVFRRDFELVPDIGVSMDEERFGDEADPELDKLGLEFADFVVKDLVPYVKKNYNVYTDASHTAIAGYSLGGLASFYLTIENPDVFGTNGGLSPSFWEYDSVTWEKYISQKKFGKDSPFLYFYTGNKKNDVEPHVSNMYKRLKKLGYPKDKLAFHYDEKGAHDTISWRGVFSEFLTGMVFNRIEPLQK